MVIIFKVQSTGDERQEDIIGQIALWFRTSKNSLAVARYTEQFLHSEEINSNFSIPVWGSVSFLKENCPDFPHPLHLLSETASCITSKVEIKNDDGLMKKTETENFIYTRGSGAY